MKRASQNSKRSQQQLREPKISRASNGNTCQLQSNKPSQPKIQSSLNLSPEQPTKDSDCIMTTERCDSLKPQNTLTNLQAQKHQGAQKSLRNLSQIDQITCSPNQRQQSKEKHFDVIEIICNKPLRKQKTLQSQNESENLQILKNSESTKNDNCKDIINLEQENELQEKQLESAQQKNHKNNHYSNSESSFCSKSLQDLISIKIQDKQNQNGLKLNSKAGQSYSQNSLRVLHKRERASSQTFQETELEDLTNINLQANLQTNLKASGQVNLTQNNFQILQNSASKPKLCSEPLSLLHSKARQRHRSLSSLKKSSKNFQQIKQIIMTQKTKDHDINGNKVENELQEPELFQKLQKGDLLESKKFNLEQKEVFSNSDDSNIRDQSNEGCQIGQSQIKKESENFQEIINHDQESDNKCQNELINLSPIQQTQGQKRFLFNHQSNEDLEQKQRIPQIKFEDNSSPSPQTAQLLKIELPGAENYQSEQDAENQNNQNEESEVSEQSSTSDISNGNEQEEDQIFIDETENAEMQAIKYKEKFMNPNLDPDSNTCPNNFDKKQLESDTPKDQKPRASRLGSKKNKALNNKEIKSNQPQKFTNRQRLLCYPKKEQELQEAIKEYSSQALKDLLENQEEIQIKNEVKTEMNSQDFISLQKDNQQFPLKLEESEYQQSNRDSQIYIEDLDLSDYCKPVNKPKNQTLAQKQLSSGVQSPSKENKGTKRGPYNMFDYEKRKQVVSYYYQVRKNIQEVASKFKISTKRVVNYVTNNANRKKGAGRKTLDKQLEIKIMNWLQDLVIDQKQLFPVRRKIQEYAKQNSSVDSFRASKGWMDKFKVRHQVRYNELKKISFLRKREEELVKKREQEEITKGFDYNYFTQKEQEEWMNNLQNDYEEQVNIIETHDLSGPDITSSIRDNSRQFTEDKRTLKRKQELARRKKQKQAFQRSKNSQQQQILSNNNKTCQEAIEDYKKRIKAGGASLESSFLEPITANSPQLNAPDNFHDPVLNQVQQQQYLQQQQSMESIRQQLLKLENNTFSQQNHQQNLQPNLTNSFKALHQNQNQSLQPNIKNYNHNIQGNLSSLENMFNQLNHLSNQQQAPQNISQNQSFNQIYSNQQPVFPHQQIPNPYQQSQTLLDNDQGLKLLQLLQSMNSANGTQSPFAQLAIGSNLRNFGQGKQELDNSSMIYPEQKSPQELQKDREFQQQIEIERLYQQYKDQPNYYQKIEQTNQGNHQQQATQDQQILSEKELRKQLKERLIKQIQMLDQEEQEPSTLLYTNNLNTDNSAPNQSLSFLNQSNLQPQNFQSKPAQYMPNSQAQDAPINMFLTPEILRNQYHQQAIHQLQSNTNMSTNVNQASAQQNQQQLLSKQSLQNCQVPLHNSMIDFGFQQQNEVQNKIQNTILELQNQLQNSNLSDQQKQNVYLRINQLRQMGNNQTSRQQFCQSQVKNQPQNLNNLFNNQVDTQNKLEKNNQIKLETCPQQSSNKNDQNKSDTKQREETKLFLNSPSSSKSQSPNQADQEANKNQNKSRGRPKGALNKVKKPQTSSNNHRSKKTKLLLQESSNNSESTKICLKRSNNFLSTSITDDNTNYKQDDQIYFSESALSQLNTSQDKINDKMQPTQHITQEEMDSCLFGMGNDLTQNHRLGNLKTEFLSQEQQSNFNDFLDISSQKDFGGGLVSARQIQEDKMVEMMEKRENAKGKTMEFLDFGDDQESRLGSTFGFNGLTNEDLNMSYQFY